MTQREILRWMQAKTGMEYATLYNWTDGSWILGRQGFVIQPFVAKRLIKNPKVVGKKSRSGPCTEYNYAY